MPARRRLLPPPRPRHRPDVSLAIVNIVLLLILFFLATGAIMNTPNTSVDLAETQDLPIDGLPRPVLVVQASGELELDEMPITRADLAEALANETLLHVLVGRDASALELLTLLDDPAFDALDIRLVTVHTESGA